MSEEKIKKSFAKGVHILANGDVQFITFKKNFISLEELQNSVKGLFEIVYLPENMILVVNEEGKLNNLPFNKIATALIQPILQDIIVGDVLLINGKYLK